MDTRKRRTKPPTSPATQHRHDSSRADKSTPPTADKMDIEETSSWRKHWMFFAVASGACAAFNGVFAKLYVIPLFQT